MAALNDYWLAINDASIPMDGQPDSYTFLRRLLNVPSIAAHREELREMDPIEKAALLLEDGHEGVYRIKAGTHTEDENNIVLNTPGYYAQRMVVRQRSALLVANRSKAKLLDPVKTPTFTIFDEGGRNGDFIFRATSSLSRRELEAKAADTAEGVFFTVGNYTAVRQGGYWVSGADPSWFGAIWDGVSDDAPPINAALSVFDVVNLPAAAFVCYSPIALYRKGHAVYGKGMWQTRIISPVRDTAIVTLGPGAAYLVVSGLSGTKTVQAVHGGNGLECIGTTDGSKVENVSMDRCWLGFKIGTCDTGTLRRCIATNSINDGYYLTCHTTYGAAQWKLDDIFAVANGRDGVRVEPPVGGPPGGMIVGGWTDIKTYGNSGYGINLAGKASTPIFDVRADNCFVGGDGLGGVCFDTYGSGHRISGFFEYAGKSANGPDLSTPATNSGDGIVITENNADVLASNIQINTNSWHGIRHRGGVLVLSGAIIVHNGQYGLLSEGGEIVVSGCRIGNLRGPYQKYGIATSHGNVTVTGNNIKGNSVAALSIAISAASIVTANALN